MIAEASGYNRKWLRGRITVSYEHGGDTNYNHRKACEALREQLGWTVKNGYPAMVGGYTADGVVWVFATDEKTEN
jgi:hypothetical protein